MSNSAKDWPSPKFYDFCLTHGLVHNSALFYISHLRRLDDLVGGLDRLISLSSAHSDATEYVSNLPASCFKSAKDKTNMLSVLRKYLAFVEAE